MRSNIWIDDLKFNVDPMDAKQHFKAMFSLARVLKGSNKEFYVMNFDNSLWMHSWTDCFGTYVISIENMKTRSSLFLKY